ncbi:hypothetical protein M2R47_05670 [Moraxella sp. Tifton1]|uniref:hypothetical protein n=1 Tax=Moraxella oculi TaxID=2940516 RepID=UPI0020132772|nr:hypothetical protein [Moraxella sp. Tifton1]MCL1623727.1 hypothetical protein [Moraxella sp. Tifton1]
MPIKDLKDKENIGVCQDFEIQHNSNNFQFKKLNAIFEYLIKFISIATIFGIIFGGINVYLYLKKINHLFLFPDNISASNVSVSIFIVHIIFYIILSFGFLSPFFINIILNNISSDFLNPGSKKQISQNSSSKNKNKLLSINPKLKNVIKFILNANKLIFSLLIPVLLFITLFFISVIGFSINIIKLFFNIIENTFFYENKKRDIIYYAKFVYWSMFWFIGIFTIIFFADSILSTSLNKYYSNILNFLTFVFIFFNIAYGFIFLNQNKLYKNNIQENSIWVLAIAMLHILPVCLHFLFVIIPTLGVLENTKTFILFYIFSIIIFSSSLLFSYLSFEYFYKNKRHNYAFYIASALFVLFYLCYVSVFSNYEVSLYKTRFIEKPQNSSWYLIHNGNAMSDTINGLTEKDIKKYQYNFEPVFWGKYCQVDVFTNQNMKSCRKLNDYINSISPNALYGYFAWNLGNTKVFCPVSVDFFDDEGNNKEKSAKCLVIDGKYLQLVSDYYLSKIPMNEIKLYLR